MTEMSIGRLLTERARTDPDEILVTDHHTSEQLTARDLDRRSNRLARVYADRGVGVDDLVTVAVRDAIDVVIVCAAVWKCGATPQPIAPDTDRTDRVAVEHAARPALVVGSPPVDRSIPWLDVTYIGDDVSDDPVDDRWASSWKAPTSSGSTGTPKVVLATAAARFDPDTPAAPFLPRSAVQLVTGPLWHSATFTYAFRGLMSDHRLVVADPLDENEFAGIVAEHGVTWTVLSPSMIHRLVRVESPDTAATDLATLESIVHLGAPCPESDKRALIDLLGPRRVVEVYAGSESNGVTMIDGVDWLQRPGSVGRPVGDTEVCVRRGDGRRAHAGEIGEIWMRRPGRPRYRYLGGGESRRDDRGWDTLGDIGFLDEEGWLTVVDRQAHVVTCAGADIYPARLEQTIVDHPAVREAVVYGARAADGGSRLCAVVDIGDAQVGRHSVETFAREHLSSHCATGRISVRRAPVRDAAGKVRRSSLFDAAAGDREHGEYCET